MLKLGGSFVTLLTLLHSAAAQSGAYGQCGGLTWTGATTCISGWTCVYQNAYYSQCLQVSTTGSATSTVTSTSATSSTSASSSGLPTATSTSKTNTVAKAAGQLYFGSATDNPELTDTTYTGILDDTTYFGQITPGNSMKWDATEPSRGTFTFTNGDVVANLAKANGQLLRGHNCVWHNQLPSWVTAGNFNATELASIITTHCSTVVGHYKGQAYAWDVVNEPINDDGTYRTSVFYNTLNTSYIATALQAARAADPSTKLYINEYNLEYAGAKFNTFLALVKQLLADGVPLDGIGFQGHLIVGSVPTAIATQLSAFTALGLEVAITELDIRMTLPATAALYNQQKTDYQTVIKACKSVAKCVGVTIWDYTDKYSWVPNTFSGQGAALPWDSNFVKKPAYDGIIAGYA